MTGPFRIRRNPDGGLPHRGLGGPQRSMYPDGNTVDEFEARIRQAWERLGDAAQEADRVMRKPLRVFAEVGRAIETGSDDEGQAGQGEPERDEAGPGAPAGAEGREEPEHDGDHPEDQVEIHTA